VTFDHLLAGLEERERTVLHLRFREDLTQAEIGDRVGISQMHVSRLIRQAIDHLRASIPQAG
jgi:RNA polymerase sigma-B factor